jgi:hypothetical protein
MVVALFLLRTIAARRFRRRETSKHQQDREMTRETVPATETGHRRETRIPLWLNPGRGGQRAAWGRSPCVPAEVPARVAALHCCRIR